MVVSRLLQCSLSDLQLSFVIILFGSIETISWSAWVKVLVTTTRIEETLPLTLKEDEGPGEREGTAEAHLNLGRKKLYGRWYWDD